MTWNPDDYLLIGADRVKRPDLLHAAYNDKLDTLLSLISMYYRYLTGNQNKVC